MKLRLSFGPSQAAHVGGELLSAYLDGQVKPEERRRVETHLGTCAACQSELANLRQTVAVLHALPRVPVPRAFTLSEAQVGLRRPTGTVRPTWFGGMARGLAAVSAVALVAVMAAVLLRQPSWQPSQNLAQLAPPAPAAVAPAASAPTSEAVVARAEPADIAKAPKAAPAGASAAPSATQAPQAQSAKMASAPTAAPLIVGTQIARLPEKPAEKAVTAIAEAQPPAAKAQAGQPVAPAPAAAAPPAAVPLTSSPTERPAAGAAALAAAVAPTATLAGARSAPQPGLEAAAAGATPAVAPTPALAGLPSQASLVYADGRGLWALDRVTGIRPLVQVEGATAPAISGDRAWVAYRLARGDNNEVWAIPSGGGDARFLLAERDLGGGLPQGYRERRIQDVRWLPGKRILLVTAQLTPVAQDALPKLEMWTVDIASGTQKLLASGDARQQPGMAPNGALIAFFRREPAKVGENSLWIIGADGSGERAALRFPVRPDARSFDGQIAWLPDSSGLWAALPDAGQPNALILYRVLLNGDAQPAGRVEGQEAFWSPNGAGLAYVRVPSETAGPRELYLAAADGANPQLYATMPSGRFIGWSPDSARFLYEDSGQLFMGAAGAKAQRLAASAAEPRWLGPSQVVYQAGQGDTWQLVTQAVDGKVVPLHPLPAGATVDSIGP